MISRGKAYCNDNYSIKIYNNLLAHTVCNLVCQLLTEAGVSGTNQQLIISFHRMKFEQTLIICFQLTTRIFAASGDFFGIAVTGFTSILWDWIVAFPFTDSRSTGSTGHAADCPFTPITPASVNRCYAFKEINTNIKQLIQMIKILTLNNLIQSCSY